MISYRNTVTVFFVLIAVTFLFFFHRSFVHERKEIQKTFLEEQEFRVNEKAKEMEMLFTQLYQGGRTISLLPGIRSLQGKNLPKDFGSQFDNQRFSEEAQMTVQQIYNNLADNIAISEIYCILDGFRPDLGETPFFMYDSLVIQKNSDAGNGTAEKLPEDFPEELEEEEYDYYLKQLEYFKKNYPRFNFTSLNEVPFIASPAMRTCDNTQYYSKVECNEKDSHGVLFSVPVYSQKGDFVGIISVIIRLNIFEAQLLDIPFLIITDRDQEEAEMLGFSMPEKKGFYALKNSTWGLSVFDRRSETLLSDINKAIEENNAEFVFSKTLQSFTQSDWELTYLASEQDLAAQVSSIWVTFLTKCIIAVVAVMAAIVLYLNFCKQRRELVSILNHMKLLAEGDVSEKTKFKGSGIMQQVADTYGKIIDTQYARVENAKAISSGDMTCEIQVNSDRDAVGLSLKKMVTELGEMIRKIKTSSSVIVTSLGNITAVSSELTTSSGEIAQRSLEVSLAAEDISQNVQSVASETEKMAASIQNVGEKATEGVDVTEKALQVSSDAFKTIESLNSSVVKINAVTDEITEIAEQSNLLALNATIEAARAGEAGKGFAVVAGEVKELAKQSGLAAGNIKSRIGLIKEDTDKAVSAIKEMSEIIKQVNFFSNLINSSVMEQIVEVEGITGNLAATNSKADELAGNMQTVSQGVASGSEEVQQINDSSRDLVKLSSELQTMVEKFKL